MHRPKFIEEFSEDSFCKITFLLYTKQMIESNCFFYWKYRAMERRRCCSLKKLNFSLYLICFLIRYELFMVQSFRNSTKWYFTNIECDLLLFILSVIFLFVKLPFFLAICVNSAQKTFSARCLFQNGILKWIGTIYFSIFRKFQKTILSSFLFFQEN